MAPARIAVAYYSMYGHVRTLADSLAAGIKESGAEVDVYQIAETLPEEVLGKMHAEQKADVPVLKADDLTKYDGFAFGFPTRYGRAVAQVSQFFDTTGGLWFQGALMGKFATTFTGSASQHGGQETTALTTLPFFAHHGINYVPAGFAAKELSDLSEIVGGSAWGAASIASSDGSRAVTDKEKSIAKQQGQHFGKVVSTYVKGLNA